MARPGQRMLRPDEGRLEDRISVGVLAKALAREVVDEVVSAAGAREQRHRMLPAWLVVYYVLALALFMDMGGGRVMRKLVGTLDWAARGIGVQTPSEEALSNARARLGPTPLRLLFEKVAGPLADPDAPGALWRGRRLLSLDGSTLDAQDTEANWARFGGPTTTDAEGTKLRGGFPQLRVVALAECGTRALVAASTGPYATGEKTLARALLARLGPRMLVVADRNFPGYELLRGAVATGTELLWRVSSSFHLEFDEVLDDGSYLSQLKAPRELRRTGACDITVRVVEYHLSDRDGNVTESFTLITSLLDPASAPVSELAELCPARWQIETALGAFKSDLKGDGVVLRSKTPTGRNRRAGRCCAPTTRSAS